MSSQDAFFSGAHCRIEVHPRETGVGEGRYVATVSLVDDAEHEVHPLIFRDGEPVAFVGSSEALAFNNSVNYLTQRFGAYAEISYATGQPRLVEGGFAEELVGRPLVVEDLGH